MNQRMKQVLILGAGRSSGFLIEYLSNVADSLHAQILVADQSLEQAEAKIQGLHACTAQEVDPLQNPEGLDKLIADSTIVISLLPVSLHLQVAKACLRHRKAFFTASYQSEELERMQDEIREQGLLFLNECGCDPGLDHMSARQLIDRVREEGHEIVSYEGYTGGLVAPVSDDNPWHYKFSWNPRNVVLAGQSGPALYWQDHRVRSMPFPRLFRAVRPTAFPGVPNLVAYYNRNSLIYRDLYGIPGASTVIRGTLRHKDFCTAWFPLSYLGLNLDLILPETTDWMLPEPDDLSFLLRNELHYTEEQVQTVLQLWTFLDLWPGSTVVGEGNLKGQTDSGQSSPPSLKPGLSDRLEDLLTLKLSLGPADRDMVVMTHQLVTVDAEGRRWTHHAHLRLEGEGGERSAMAKTVGWPLALAVERYLKGETTQVGLQRPLEPTWYKPILQRLSDLGIALDHRSVQLP